MRDFSSLELRARRMSPGVADMLLAGEELMKLEPPLAATVSLVSHCMREIESAIHSVFRSIVMQDDSQGIDHKSEILFFAKSLSVSPTEEPFRFWLALAGTLHGFAHRRNLEQARPITSAFLSKWESFLDWIQDVLNLVETRSSSIYDDIDRLFTGSRSPSDVCNLFKSRVPQNEHTLSYFLGKLEGPQWFYSLRKHHFFDTPPPLRKTALGYTWQIWPPSISLIGFAATGQIPAKEIEGVINELVGASQPSIQSDLIRIALLLPAECSVEIARAAATWLSLPYIAYELPNLITLLVEHLATAGQHSVAEMLGFASLRIRRIRKGRRVVDTQVGIHSTYSLQRTIPRLATALSLAGDIETLRRACSMLRIAATAKSSSHKRQIGDDHSTSWRKSIGSDPRERDYEQATFLVDFVRDLSLALIDQGTNADELVTTLLQQKSGVCRRIGLWVLSERLPRAPTAVREVLAQAGRWDRYIYEREFWHLAQALSQEDPRAAKQLIVKLPELARARAKRWSTSYHPVSEVAVRTRWWVYERLHLMRQALEYQGLSQLAELQTELGPLERDPLAPNYPRSFTVTSPVQAAEVAAMNPQQVVRFAQSFSDSSGLTDVDALVGEVRVAITANPTKYADEAFEFIALGPEHVSSILRGFEWALLDGKSFSWGGILSFLDLILAGKWPTKKWDLRSSQWALEGAAELLNQGLRGSNSGIELFELPRVFGLVKLLGEIPAEVEDDLLGLTDNRVSLLAFDALLGLVWRCRALSDPLASEAESTILATIGAFMTERGTSFREHLGSRFVELDTLVPEIAQDLQPRLFPLEGVAEVFVAAWGGYAAHRHPSVKMMSLLAPQYIRAVDLMLPGTTIAPLGSALNGLLIDLLFGVVFYEVFELKPVLAYFYKIASGELREWMIHQVGFALFQSEKPVEPVLLERIQDFLDGRLADCMLELTPEALKETQGFIRLATFEVLPDSWMLPRLLQSLRVSSGIEDIGLLIYYLAKSAVGFPQLSVECLAALYHARAPGSTVIGIEEEVKRILEVAENSGIGSAQDLAYDVRNRLVHEAGPRFRRDK